MAREKSFRLGTGWVPDPEDPRDRKVAHGAIRPLLERGGLFRFLGEKRRLPAKADLRKWCPPVVFQGKYDTCSAHVVAELLEYFEKRAFDKTVAASRLFLHKVAKNFLGEKGNVGVHIRQVMGVLRLVGVPPEKYWPYPDPGTMTAPLSGDPRLDAEPTAFCYAIARDFHSIAYYRLDDLPPRVDDRAELLVLLKRHLAAGLPVTVGFPLYASLAAATKTGRIPMPAPGEATLGNHAVVAVGYDDHLEISNPSPKGPATKGALLFQNSWSEAWGEKGFGWLPYEFVLSGGARDLWTLLSADWIETGNFQLDL